ncbi:MAG: pyridoxal phosphate-dependent aminotransferase [Pseudomonadota bacterium]
MVEKVKIHTLFQYLLETTDASPEAFLGFSLAQPPTLGAYLNDLDPDLPLDWNGQSFRGLPKLVDHILRQANLDLPHDSLLVTAGAAEANYLAFQQLVRPGNRVVTETPGWPQIDVLGQAIGAKMVHVTRRAEDAWAFPMAAFKKAVTKTTQLVFLTNPNNPTGKLLTEDELTEIVSICRAADAWLVVDEVYAGLEWTGPRPPSIAGLYEKGITTGSVSKALGLQGLRTGWLICPDPDMVMDAVILRENSSEIMNILGEHIAEIALRPGRYDAALRSTRADAKQTLNKLDSYISAQSRLSWHRPEAGLIGLAHVTGEDGDTLARNLLADPYRTFLLPGSSYGVTDHIRLGVGGGTAANLDLGLTRLADYLGT